MLHFMPVEPLGHVDQMCLDMSGAGFDDVARNGVAMVEQSASRKIMPLARFGTPASP